MAFVYEDEQGNIIGYELEDEAEAKELANLFLNH